jgi:hypothetical protein
MKLWAVPGSPTTLVHAAPPARLRLPCQAGCKEDQADDPAPCGSTRDGSTDTGEAMAHVEGSILVPHDHNSVLDIDQPRRDALGQVVGRTLDRSLARIRDRKQVTHSAFSQPGKHLGR